MILIPLGILWLGYTLGWYGYATLQQPISGGCTGFTDLILPTHIASVDSCITNNWGKGGSNGQSAVQSQSSSTTPSAPARKSPPAGK